jgi:hypothetical protein
MNVLLPGAWTAELERHRAGQHRLHFRDPNRLAVSTDAKARERECAVNGLNFLHHGD